MSLPVIWRALAADDVRAISSSLEEQQQGLAGPFVTSLDLTIGLIGQHPLEGLSGADTPPPQ